MVIDRPPQVFAHGFIQGARDERLVDGNMMLEAVLADIGQQFLETRHLHHPLAPKRLQGICRKRSFTYVGAHLAGQVIS